jgi:hypothetical protein
VELARAGLLSSVRGDWRTPPEVLDRVRRVARIGIDPCGGPGSLVGADVEWCGGYEDDGLRLSWSGTLRGTSPRLETGGIDDGLVYVNPPYGRRIGDWVAKIIEETNEGCEILALVPSRTDAGWWQWLAGCASCAALSRGRIRFLPAPGVAESQNTVGSTFVYFGPRVGRFRAAFCADGFAREVRL